jgi:hypothetical protein
VYRMWAFGALYKNKYDIERLQILDYLSPWLMICIV